MRDIQAFTRQRSAEMADYLDACRETPLRFVGDDPNLHSAHNHLHLFHLIAVREEHGWIDTAYRTAFVDCIFDRWQARLKGFSPYSSQGYRLYLYQDFAPTISVVAETPQGFPYPGAPFFVDSPARIMALYADFRLSDAFGRATLRDAHILQAVERHKGSTGKPTAQALGMQVGELRRAIEWWGVQREVNTIRKRHARRPAKFRNDHEMPFTFKVFEARLPAKY